ncbi:hypothetical protein [Parabacteroides distasonis]|uniref:DUF3868 domain-containing protein n=1 Tax=Parabacteroides distasonis TaxID=823 RepID=A0A4S2ELI5_PARDI|nr:hypothetical protein [Parabacteroides distasonis]TGY56362.1 hypothetical protein E5342_12360 [Parabacteroides distasonis]
MKRLVMAMSALLVSVTMSFAQESSLHKEPFVVNVGQLVSYLELRPSQINEVAMINVTNNNNRMTSRLSFPDVYLADK